MLANDNIQIALIGAGGMGQGDAELAVRVPGVKLVAACDLYDGRLAHMKEVYPGIATTRDYQEILGRKDIDAVIIGTPDHWHSRITIDAMNSGKDVYCEKPMVQKIEQGKPVIEAMKKTGRILQIGSQYASSPVYLRAAELLKQGAIGKVNMVEAWLDRNTGHRRVAVFDSAGCLARDGRLAPLYRARSEAAVRRRRGSSGGGIIAITARAWRAICSSTS